MDTRLNRIASRAKAQGRLFVRDVSDDRAGRRMMARDAAQRFTKGDSLWI